MTLVRKRRHQQALRLSLLPPPRRPLPLPSPAAAEDNSGSWREPPPPSSTVETSPVLAEHPPVETLADFEKLALLGRGSGGRVYKVRHLKTQILYALKVLRFDQNAAFSVFHHQAASEAEILKRIDSSFIVKCYGVFNTSADGDLCLVMELMEKGSLHDALLARQVLTEPAISSVASRVLHGLHYLKGMQIVHGDIKPPNLLVNDEGEIKIADFGVSRVVAGTRYDSDGTCMGTCAYMSPERVDPERWGSDEAEEADGYAGDVWSLGVVVLECYVGHYPLIREGDTADWAGLMYAICYGERVVEMPESASPEFRGFVGRCLEKDWRKRGTVDELLHHPFVNKDMPGSV